MSESDHFQLAYAAGDLNASGPLLNEVASVIALAARKQYWHAEGVATWADLKQQAALLTLEMARTYVSYEGGTSSFATYLYVFLPRRLASWVHRLRPTGRSKYVSVSYGLDELDIDVEEEDNCDGLFEMNDLAKTARVNRRAYRWLVTWSCGYDISEVAEMYGVARSTIWDGIQKVRKQLRQELERVEKVSVGQQAGRSTTKASDRRKAL